MEMPKGYVVQPVRPAASRLARSWAEQFSARNITKTGLSSFEEKNVKALNLITLILIIVGGINWLLVGLFQLDLVAAIFDGQDSGLPLSSTSSSASPRSGNSCRLPAPFPSARRLPSACSDGSSGRNRMTEPAGLEAKFWKALKSDRTMMLGVSGVDEGHTRPMTAQLEGDEGGPIWFFAAKDDDLVKQLRGNDRAIATFASKDHDVFAAVHGSLRVDTDRAVVDRLWNRFVAAWYEGGNDDPKLVLLRLDPDAGQVWADASSVAAGVKIFLGLDPKEDYKDKVAKVDLS